MPNKIPSHIAREAFALISALDEIREEGAEQVYFGAGYLDNDDQVTVGDVIKALAERTKCYLR